MIFSGNGIIHQQTLRQNNNNAIDCENCQSCEQCNIIENWIDYKGQVICEACENCQNCVHCDNCEGCLTCNICLNDDNCKLCQTCLSRLDNDVYNNCLYACQSCDTCDSCNTCQSCNEGCQTCQEGCEVCESCNEGCQTCQEGCEVNCESTCQVQCQSCDAGCQNGNSGGSEVSGDWNIEPSWDGCSACNVAQLYGSVTSTHRFRANNIKSGDEFLTTEEWNGMVDYIDKIFNFGQHRSSDDVDYCPRTVQYAGPDNPVITAANFNALINDLNTCGANFNDFVPKIPGDPIEASLFQQIQQKTGESGTLTFPNRNCESCNMGCQICDENCNIGQNQQPGGGQ